MLGIITFQDTTNYGAMLQTYALQEKLFQLGWDNLVINYRNETLNKNERPICLRAQKSLYGVIKYLLLHNDQIKRFRNFKEFYEINVKATADTFDKNTIHLSNNLFDSFIVGSDQVWNLDLTGSDFNYLLKFANNDKTRISYASSLGGFKISSDNRHEYFECLKSFKKLLVREKEGLTEINEKLGLNGEVVLDPTLLLNDREWDKLVSNKLDIKEDYILVYFIDRTKENFEYIRTFAKRKNCKLIYLHNYLKKEHGMINNRTYGPAEFLYLIKNAKYVFTGSFHGLCFSLNYGKNLFLTVSPAKEREGRLINLLNVLNIDTQTNPECDTIKTVTTPNEIIQSNLTKERSKSVQYLKEGLSLL